MLIVFLIIGAGLVILGAIGLNYWDCDGLCKHLCWIGGCIAGCCIVAMPFLICNVIIFSQMDERIAIYQEENIRIEEQVKTTVEAYQEYEKEIFENIDLDKISGEKLILLTSVYPELKSDALVQELVSVYTNNNNQIKELRMQKLDYKISRWWLYFG